MAYIGNAPAAGVISGDNIQDSTVGTADLATGAVTTAKLADAAVTTAKIADGAVVTADIADSAVTAAKLASTAVTDKLGYTPVNKAGDTMTGPLGTNRVDLNGDYSSIHFSSAASGDCYLDVEPGTRTVRTRNWNGATPNIESTAFRTGTLLGNEVRLFAGNSSTPSSMICERFSITATSGGVNVAISTGTRFNGFIIVSGPGNDTSGGVWAVSSNSEYGNESISLITKKDGDSYTGPATISLSSPLSGNVVLTVTGSGTRTYDVFTIGHRT